MSEGEIESCTIVCPAQEEFVNGSFETGDFTGWGAVYMSVVDSLSHTGSYSARLFLDVGILGFLTQSFARAFSPVNLSKASFWSYGPKGALNLLLVTYEDSSEDIKPFTISDDDTWEENDFSDILDATKKVAIIELVVNLTGMGGYVYIDDFSILFEELSFDCFPIAWAENQDCKPAVRDVQFSDSQYLDDGTWVLSPRELQFTVRMTDREKKTFDAMFERASDPIANVYVNIFLFNNAPDHSSDYWLHEAWIEDKSTKWEYVMQKDRQVRWWKVTLTCKVQNFAYVGVI